MHLYLPSESDMLNAQREHTHTTSPGVIVGAYQTPSPNQKKKVESWHLFIPNRAGQPCVIDARQTMHVSGVGGPGRAGIVSR